MSIYRWTVRAGGPLLFCFSLIVFAVTLGSQFKLGEQMTYDQFSSAVGDSSARFTFLMMAVASALNNAAYLFFGACILDRIDRFLSSKEVGE